jgi:hypothetical protein
MAGASRLVAKKYKTFHPYRDGYGGGFDGR